MDESHKSKMRDRSQNTIKYILYDWINIKHKTQQNSSMLTEDRISGHPLEGSSNWKGAQGESLG